MASSTSADRNIPFRLSLPAIAQCVTRDRKEAVLGLNRGRNPCSTTMVVHLDEIQKTFSCRLQVPIKLKNAKNNKTNVYVLVKPKNITVKKDWDGHVPKNILNTFVSGNACASSKDIICLSLALAAPSMVVGPKVELPAKSTMKGRILEAMILFGQAENLTIYLPSKKWEQQRLFDISTDLEQGVMSSSFNIRTMYGGEGGRIIQTIDGKSRHEENSVPPMYEEIVSSPPRDVPSKRAQRSPCSSVEEPPTKRRDCKAQEPLLVTTSKHLWTPSQGQSQDPDRAWKQAVTEQLVALTAQLTRLTNEVNSRPEYPHAIQTADAAVQTEDVWIASNPNIEGSRGNLSTASTIDYSLEDRIAATEVTVDKIQTRLTSVQDSIKSTVAEIACEAVDNATKKFQILINDIGEDVSNKVQEIEDRVHDFEDLDKEIQEMEDRVHEMVDDMVCGVKLELRDYIDEELTEYEDNLTDKVRTSLHNATLDINFDVEEQGLLRFR